MDLRTAAADLLVGADCPGCGAPALDWCRECARAARPSPRLVAVGHPGVDVPVCAAAENTGVVADLVVAWKDADRHRLTRHLGLLLAAACVPFLPDAVTHDQELLLVPVPSTPATVRRRGADLAADLARRAAAELATTGTRVRVVPMLRRGRRTRDQVGLGARDRRRNMAGAFSPSARSATPATGRVLVVDDVVTTGSSIAEAIRVLRSRGLEVVGSAVVARTPGPVEHTT